MRDLSPRTFATCRCGELVIERHCPANHDRPAMRWHECARCGERHGPVEMAGAIEHSADSRPSLARVAALLAETPSC